MYTDAEARGQQVSTLYVIRHGQASFGAKDYDVLTDLGREQARRLGAWLAGRGIDAVYTGPRRRHRDTADLLCRAHGGCPEPVEVAGLDEYPAEVIMRRALPQLLATDPRAREIFGGDPPGPVDSEKFQALFEEVMNGWVRGAHDHPEVESFAAFSARVTDALRGIIAGAGRGRTLLVSTSAGPVAIALQMTLDLAGPVALRQSWVVANTAITEIKFRDDEVTLVSFNGTPHLPERPLITYR
jgi:broad specificity phosphatase PhoE